MGDYSNLTEQSYWIHNGKYQKEYNMLFGKLVPFKGKAQTMHGEALRCISKVYYDRYNNGHGNNDVLNNIRVYEYLIYVAELIEDAIGYDLEDLFKRLSKTPGEVTNEILEHAVNCVIEYCWFVRTGLYL